LALIDARYSRLMPLPLQPSSIVKLHEATVGSKFTKCAYARLQTYCMANEITMSDLVRRLVKTGWAIHFDGQDIDMPPGTDIKLAAGTPGANGAADLPGAL
jgi:hypothetical protein